jgi:hypothetical protein
MKINNKFLTVQNAKTSKGESLGYLTGILYLAPADLVKGVNLCPFATEGCKKACLYTAGRGKFSNVQNARIKKTELFRDNRDLFFQNIKASIELVVKQATKQGLIPVIRLNGTSDIPFENFKVYNGLNIFELFPDVQFYDYTKNLYRIDKTMPKNYHLTYSGSMENSERLTKVLRAKKVNTALVFRNELPKAYKGVKVISGDNHDLRFLDGQKGYIIGLKAKGDAKKDVSGFVIQ